MILHLFDGFGVELEYMIVDRNTLKVKPISDKLIFAVAKEYVSDVEFDEIGWSNELVLHVIELKTNGPAKKLEGLDELFLAQIKNINSILKEENAKLLPTGAHPFMEPLEETKLWPHDYNIVYETYNKIFDCRGHGWANLQSVHLNLPFYNDEEFEKLHAAVRILLPIMPALCASTPFLECKATGFLDSRLEIYRNNQKKIPSIAGAVIPEPVFSKNEYEEKIFKRIFADIAPFDKEEILQDEWLNSRGAIARFQRNTIEIRILDIQECPAADIAIISMFIEVIKMLISEKFSSLEEQKKWNENDLSQIFLEVIKNAENSVIKNKEYLRLFGCNNKSEISAGDLWRHIVGDIKRQSHEQNHFWISRVDLILTEGTLATRILKAAKGNFSLENIIKIYNQLSECLATNEMFMQ